MKTDKDKPELLAPAGTIEAGLAAFDAGADAVYAGLARFNARERGQNFTLDQLRKLLAQAHKHGRKVYLTLNTLLKDSELPEAVEMLADVALYRPDAILVQDVGLVRVIREHFPMLEIHASTQMGIHNSAGARMVQKMGIQRVILERQVTYEEIAEIRKNTSIDVEVFVHGALCCSRSGVCLFSSWMGGWSGNRGKCKQPCRRRYHSKDGNGFFFSPNDLYSLDAIPELCRLGVKSLKIEGRLRRADYVSRVVTAYRMMLDAEEDETRATLKEAKAILAGALGRKWQPAFRQAKDLINVIQHTTVAAAGLLCGKVIKASERGFLVDVSRTLRLNDTIRVQPNSGDEGPLMTLTRISVNKKKVNQAKKGQQAWIHFDKPVPPNAKVYKTGIEPPDVGARVDKLPLARPVVDFDIAFGEQGVDISITLGAPTSSGKNSANTFQAAFHADVELEPAQKQALSQDQVAIEFRKSGQGHFEAGEVTVSLPDNRFLRASLLKELRRTFWSWVNEQISDQDLIALKQEQLQDFEKAFNAPFPQAEGAPETTVRLGPGKKNPVPGSIMARDISDAFSKNKIRAKNNANEFVLPDFCSEFDLVNLKEQVAKAVAAGKRCFRITSLFGFELLQKIPDLKLSASFPLPVCNRFAVRELAGLGATKATAWVELEEESLQSLVKTCKGWIEIFTYGRIPLLVTRLAIPVSGAITDGRGAGFEVVSEAGQSMILPAKALSVPVPKGASTFVDLTHAALNEGETSLFNVDRDFV